MPDLKKIAVKVASTGKKGAVTLAKLSPAAVGVKAGIKAGKWLAKDVGKRDLKERMIPFLGFRTRPLRRAPVASSTSQGPRSKATKPQGRRSQ